MEATLVRWVENTARESQQKKEKRKLRLAAPLLKKGSQRSFEDRVAQPIDDMALRSATSLPIKKGRLASLGGRSRRRGSSLAARNRRLLPHAALPRLTRSADLRRLRSEARRRRRSGGGVLASCCARRVFRPASYRPSFALKFRSALLGGRNGNE